MLHKLLKKINLQWIGRTRSPKSSNTEGVGYLSFLLRSQPKPKPKVNKPYGLFVTAYDENMNQRECLGEYEWSKIIEKELIEKVITKAKTTSRLTGGKNLNIPVKYYTITYLYKSTLSRFIRGYHAVLKNALYLPGVFLENTFDNGKWIKSSDTSWPQEYNFDKNETNTKLNIKAGKSENTQWTLFDCKVKHVKLTDY